MALGSNYMSYNTGNHEDKYDSYMKPNSSPPENRPMSTLQVGQIERVPPSLGTTQARPYEVPETRSAEHYSTCPECKNTAISVCGCEYKDATCPNGHSWFFNNGNKQLGRSHKR